MSLFLLVWLSAIVVIHPGVVLAKEAHASSISAAKSPRRFLEEGTTQEQNQGASYFTCVDKTSDSLYTALFQPCIVTLYQVEGGEDTLPFDNFKDPKDADYVNGVLETCSILKGYELKKFATSDVVAWEDPCVGLKERCYDMAQLSTEQRRDIADMLNYESSRSSAAASLVDLYDQTTHIAINCTADYQSKEDLAKALTGAGAAFLGSVICCCWSCIAIIVLVLVIALVCCCQQQQQHRHSYAVQSTTATAAVHHPVASQVEIPTVGIIQAPVVAKPIPGTVRPAGASATVAQLT